jgi:hypothetical protein
VRRLTFAVQDGVIKLISEQEVDMQPIAVPAVSHGVRHEFWFEVRDIANATLIVQPARDPMPKDIEVFSDDPSRSACHAHDPRTEQAFSVVLPSVQGADSVVLMRAGTAQGAAVEALETRTAATEIARFKLSKS